MAGFPIVTFQKKETDKYVLKIPDSEDLILQIFFKGAFRKLVETKKVYKLERLLVKKLEASDLEGEYEIELIPVNESICVTSPGFWKSLVTDSEALLSIVEGSLNEVL